MLSECLSLNATDDSDSDSEAFWGGLVRRVAAKRQPVGGIGGSRARSGADLPALYGNGIGAAGVDTSSLSFSRRAAAAQHPVFDLSDPEVLFLLFLFGLTRSHRVSVAKCFASHTVRCCRLVPVPHPAIAQQTIMSLSGYLC